MRSLTRPPVIDKLRLPNRLLHYQRPFLLSKNSPASAVQGSTTVVNASTSAVSVTTAVPRFIVSVVSLFFLHVLGCLKMRVEMAALWHLFRSYRDSFEDLMIQEIVLYPRACMAPSDRLSPSCYLPVIKETNHPSYPGQVFLQGHENLGMGLRSEWDGRMVY